MDWPVIKALALASIVIAAPIGAAAHQLVVFASVECEVVTVEAKFSNGRVTQKGDVRVLDGENNLLTTLQLEKDGTALVPLDSVDHSSGLLIEVDTGGHDNYWIVTPEDIAKKCGS
jgi:nickel transport protein